MSKLDVLRAICEQPGWQPPTESSSIERYLQELLNEGWVLPRLDGWEATAMALEAYPHFTLNADGTIEGHIPLPEPTPEPASANGGLVPVERVVVLIRGMLEVLPVLTVARLLDAKPEAFGPPDDLGWQVARDLLARAKG